MTRETKVGVVVSGSFLCLVGVVLFNKLREPNALSAGTENSENGSMVSEEPTPVEELGAAHQPEAATHATAVKVEQELDRTPTKGPGAIQLLSGQSTEGAKPLPTPNSTNHSPNNVPTDNKQASNPITPKAVAINPVKEVGTEAISDQTEFQNSEKEKTAAEKAAAAAVPKFEIGNKDAPKEPALPSFMKNVKESPPANTIPTQSEAVKQPVVLNSGAGAPIQDQAKTNPVFPNILSSTGTAETNPGTAVQPRSNPVNSQRTIAEPPAPPAAAPSIQNLVSSPNKNVKEESKPVVGSITGLPALGQTNSTAVIGGVSATQVASDSQSPLDKTPVSATGGLKETNPSALGSDATAGKSGFKELNPLGAAQVGNHSSGAATVADQNAGSRISPPMNLRPLGEQEINNTQDKNQQNGPKLGTLALTPPSNPFGQASLRTETLATRSQPALGAGIPLQNRSIGVAAPAIVSQVSSNPQVESYDEDTYSCRGNETMRSISQSYYQSDRYEQALLLFNRSHPLAADAVRTDPPRLQPGTSIYVPPARILEKYYATAIAEGPAPVTEPGAIVRNREIVPAVRPNLAPTTQAAPLFRTEATESSPFIRPTPAVPQKPAPAAEKTYKVGSNGESFYEIARRTLTGDADMRWYDISKLNPGLNPQELVPAGTVLRMPSDAKVGVP